MGQYPWLRSIFFAYCKSLTENYLSNNWWWPDLNFGSLVLEASSLLSSSLNSSMPLPTAPQPLTYYYHLLTSVSIPLFTYLRPSLYTYQQPTTIWPTLREKLMTWPNFGKKWLTLLTTEGKVTHWKTSRSPSPCRSRKYFQTVAIPRKCIS